MTRAITALLVACVVVFPLEAQVRTPPRKRPTVTKPTTVKPTKAKPATTKPTKTRPAATTPVSPKPTPTRPAVPAVSQPEKPVTPVTPRTVNQWRPYSFAVFTSELYDSNIERDKENPIPSNGFVVGGVVRYASAAARPGLSAAYEVARHAYSRNEQFDRISQNLSLVLARRLFGELTAEVIGEAALKGSSEDRDVGNQFVVLPRFSYRLDAARRLRAYGAYRVRRYDTNADRDAVNRYIGAELRSDVGEDARVEVGYRYETNSARSERRSYVRRTYTTGFTRSFGRNNDVFAELKFRSQRYDKRLVEVDDEDVPRHDYRITPTVEWNHRFGAGFSVIANYNFENRTSNDPDNGYLNHVFALTARYDW